MRMPLPRRTRCDPTLGEASKRAAGGFYTSELFDSRTRKLVRFLQRLS